MFQHNANEQAFLTTSQSQDCRFLLPGYGRPLDFYPVEKDIYGVESRSMFPSALDDRDIEIGYTELPVQTLREKAMVDVMEDLTDIPGWWNKIHDFNTAKEWKDMALKKGTDITENMAEWIIDELKFKAMIYEVNHAVALYNGDITKSDTNVPKSIIEELRCATRTLETNHPDLQFYQPGSLSKQRDLLAMALYPLIYGRSRILPDKLIGLDEALRYAGQGETIPIPQETGITREDIAWRVYERSDIQVRPYSRNFQALPTDWKLGDDGKWHITTYINNLHPVKHRNIYDLIERAFNCLIPQWNMTMTPLKDMLHSRARIEYHKAEYYPVSKEVLDSVPQIKDREAQSEYYERVEKWRMAHFRSIQPDVDKFVPWAVPHCMMSKLPEDLPAPVRIEQGVNLNNNYKERGLQVITRLMGVDLTPDDPYYETYWHVEGQMNEHICAAAFLTYDSDNMEEPSMEFRNIVDVDALTAVEHDPNDFTWLKQVFGMENGEPAIQHSGSIRCQIGRTVMFPSTVQHRLTKFELKDKTKSGSTRALVFYLVDPNIRIISTGNIPPQRLDWTLNNKDAEAEDLNSAMVKLALDNKDNKGNMPMSLGEALEVRKDSLNELVEFMRYQHVAFESRVLML
ncbi:Protein of unknown function DUF4246 [Penicillium angulare]|uniref:Protein of unknown function DUF4246 n=1 Tax=Penicillium angulare TaxID=116970 RepID=UPI00253FEA50|nr:Protein of unknown function DUF4246 [Penicillium angulare]KAJ5267619.1 Protein of unknown function DUF4246 [Penicillium angulare]